MSLQVTSLLYVYGFIMIKGTLYLEAIIEAAFSIDCSQTRTCFFFHLLYGPVNIIGSSVHGCMKFAVSSSRRHGICFFRSRS